MATAIKKAPDAKVTGLGAPTRSAGGTTVTAKWSVPASAKKESNTRRATSLDVRWTVTYRDFDTGREHSASYTKTGMGIGTTEHSMNLFTMNNWKADSTKKTCSMNDLYPRKGSTGIVAVTAQVRLRNAKGVGPWVSATRKFGTSKPPTMEEPVQNAETGVVSVTVKPSDDESNSPRWQTCHTCTVTDSRDGVPVVTTGRDTTGNEFTVSTNVSDRMGLSYDDYVRVAFEALCRDFAGPSKAVGRTLYVSWPNKPTILGIDVPTASDGKVTVRIDLNRSDEHPTTGVRLEALKDVAYTSADDIPGSASWQELGAVDDGACTALSATVTEVNPDVGTRTWVRAKVWNQIESIFYRYSDPVELSELHRETNASAGGATIISAIPGTDGTSAEVLLGWLADSADGTQLAWSDSLDAWRSTKAPETFDVTWDDGQRTIGSTMWPHTALVHVAGLTEGRPTYFRARRYIEAGSGRQNGTWWPTLASEPTKVTPSTQATQVTLTAPQVVARGSSLELAWTYDTEASQAGWQVVTGTVVEVTDYETDDHGTTYSARKRPTIAASGRTIVAEGADERGACRIDGGRIAGLAGGGSSVAFAVRASTGGEWVESDAVAVAIADPPTLAVAADDVAAQPAEVTIACSTAGADVAIVVRAQGAQGDSPTGTATQAAGDTVWSAVLGGDLAWEAVYAQDAEEGDPPTGYECTVTLPEGLDLWDGARYDVAATATDRSTGLASDVATCEFGVDWERKATDPTATVAPYDTTDPDSGVRTRGCVVTIGTPTASEEGDLCDLYRLTRDGARLVARDLPCGTVVDDPFAPFGTGAQLAYRVALRTPDGSVAWDDFGYALGGLDLRVDFGGEYVELPYNLGLSGGYAKDFEGRRKLDGSIDGYWGEGVERKAGLSTDLVKVGDEDAKRSVVALARHVGPCLVRTPDGSCYCADVQVTDLSQAYDSGLVAVALDASEVDLTAEYMAVAEPPEQPEETEQQGGE